MIPNKYLNQVLNTDVMNVLRDLPDNSIDMIYADPDYNVGIDYGGHKYNFKWDNYIDWYGDLMRESMRVLKEKGNLFTINFPKQNSYLRVKHLDAIAYHVQDYSWVYKPVIGMSKRRFTTGHRSILHATKSKENNFYKEAVAIPYVSINDKRTQATIKDKGYTGRMPYSWFKFNTVNNVSKEKTIHPCQIPLKLARMLFNASTIKGDTIFVLFGGSGGEVFLAKHMGRNFISCELNKDYHEMILDRLEQNGSISSQYKRVQKKEVEINPFFEKLLSDTE